VWLFLHAKRAGRRIFRGMSKWLAIARLRCEAGDVSGGSTRRKEFLAGFGIIDVSDLDAALEWAARHPAAAYASVEVRPLLGSHFAVGGNKPSS
jgi:hypothetical protein